MPSNPSQSHVIDGVGGINVTVQSLAYEVLDSRKRSSKPPSINDGQKPTHWLSRLVTNTGQRLRDVVCPASTSIELLSNVDAVFSAGRLTAIMGPSGGGKSTLLDVMSGRKTTGRLTSGAVLYAGQPASEHFLRRHTGYVEQFDTLLPALTPREMLMYTAQLKRTIQEPTSAKRAVVESVIEKLALSDCSDVMIGSLIQKGISGGQAKRTNIGLALVSSPRVVFMGA
jgi:ABC-type multidrug transport system ATPase subunit